MPSNLNVFGFSIQLGLKDMTQPGLLSLTKSLDNAAKSTKSAQGAIDKLRASANQMGMTAIGLGLATNHVNNFADNIFKKLDGATEATAAFNLELARLKFTAGASNSEMREMVDLINTMGRSSIFKGTDITKGAYELVSAGLTLTQAKQALDATLKFTTVSGGQVGIEQSAKTFGAVFNKFKIDPSQAKRVSDMMVEASNKSAFQFGEIPKFFNSLQDAPMKMNASLETVLGMGMALRNAGQNPREAGQKINSFANALLNITAQIDRAAMRESEGKSSGSIQKYRMKLLKDIGFGQTNMWENGKMRPVLDILNDLVAGSSKVSDKQKTVAKKTVFAQNASTVWSIIEQMDGMYKKWDKVKNKWVYDPSLKGKSIKTVIEELIGSEGATDLGAKTYLEELDGKLKRLANTADMLKIHFGQSFAPFKMFSTDVKHGILAGLDEMITKFPALGTAVAGVTWAMGGLAKAAGVALGIVTLLALAGAGVKYIAADMLEYGIAKNSAAMKAGAVLPFGSLTSMSAIAHHTTLKKAAQAAKTAALRGAGLKGNASAAAIAALAITNPTAHAAVMAQQAIITTQNAAIKTAKTSVATTNWKTFFKEFITHGWQKALPWIKLVGSALLKIGLWSLAGFVAWKSNFLGIRTIIEGIFGAYKKGIDIAQEPLDKFLKSFRDLNTLQDVSARNWARYAVLWDALNTFWTTGLISGEQFIKINESGMGGLFNTIVRIGKAGEDIGKGFQSANDWVLKTFKSLTLYDKFLPKDKLGIGGKDVSNAEGWLRLGKAIFWVSAVFVIFKTALMGWSIITTVTKGIWALVVAIGKIGPAIATMILQIKAMSWASFWTTMLGGVKAFAVGLLSVVAVLGLLAIAANAIYTMNVIKENKKKSTATDAHTRDMVDISRQNPNQNRLSRLAQKNVWNTGNVADVVVPGFGFSYDLSQNLFGGRDSRVTNNINERRLQEYWKGRTDNPTINRPILPQDVKPIEHKVDVNIKIDAKGDRQFTQAELDQIAQGLRKTAENWNFTIVNPFSSGQPIITNPSTRVQPTIQRAR